MKPRSILLTGLLTLLLWAASCSKADNPIEEGEEVTILISTSDNSKQTRASNDSIDPLEEGNHSTDPDYKIETLRVLIFHESNGVLHRNSGKFTPPDNPQFVTLKTGRYNFVFIANEDRDPALTAKLNAMTEDTSHYWELMELTMNHSAFNSRHAGGSQDFTIPKVIVKGRVLVSKRDEKILVIDPEENIKVSDLKPNSKETPWEVEMIQAGIRINLELKLSAYQMEFYDAGKFEVTLSNIPNHVDLLGKYNYTSGQTISRTLGTPVVNAAARTLTWNRIILPETSFFDKSVKENGILLTVYLEGEPFTARLYYEGENESGETVPIYALRRGIQLNVLEAIILQKEVKLNNVTVHGWGNAINGGGIEL